MSNESWLRGSVVRGDGRGRTLGFPTANLVLEDATLTPPDGVYAAWVKVGDAEDSHPAAVHVGPAPAMKRASSSFEVHLVNFPDRDLYDATLLVQIVERLRGVEHFDNVESLVSAIEKDCRKTLRLLGFDTS